MCLHTTIYVSSYYCVCVLILLYYMCPHTTIYVSSCYSIHVLILLYTYRRWPGNQSRWPPARFWGGAVLLYVSWYYVWAAAAFFLICRRWRGDADIYVSWYICVLIRYMSLYHYICGHICRRWRGNRCSSMRTHTTLCVSSYYYILIHTTTYMQEMMRQSM
jgi:hypothetical protein